MLNTTTDDGQTEWRAMAKGRVGKHGKTRGRPPGSKNKKPQSWANQYANVPTDCGTYERWMQQIGIEQVDESNETRRQVFNCLTLNDRVIDPGGRVVSKGAEDQFEHPTLDGLRKAGILDDPADPGRAKERVEAGIELLRLAVVGKVVKAPVAAWRAVGGGNGGGVTQAEAEGIAARAEMKYLDAKYEIGVANWDMIRAVCIEFTIPPGTKRTPLVNALDLLGEYLLHNEPPKDVVRPKVHVRDRTIPSWLKIRK